MADSSSWRITERKHLTASCGQHAARKEHDREAALKSSSPTGRQRSRRVSAHGTTKVCAPDPALASDAPPLRPAAPAVPAAALAAARLPPAACAAAAAAELPWAQVDPALEMPPSQPPSPELKPAWML